MITRHYKIYGRVQGVGFRKATVSLAAKYDVTGTVANVEDFVEIFVAGNEQTVEQFMKRILKGPNVFAKVTSFEYETLDHRDYKQFTQV
ncbi:acylphosphatase [Macrococcus carouselicus]|uniref:acylphosphatase n=1 Tax=Macrococcus carouselicus TaxID=69969 RepID=A0A9Q8CP50_9STAP|nr:acylphosphatase [Macrococcus carouselicus]TDM04212.1 acylphosphatase [Macrococcus carouselicus]